MPNLTDAVLLAATVWPGAETAQSLAKELDRNAREINAAIADLRERGLLQKRRGSPRWPGKDRLRSSKAGAAACKATLSSAIAG
jgi:predicted HTH transcriptional regulator